MSDNTKVNQNISNEHQPSSVQMNTHFYLIFRDKESLFFNQFSVPLFDYFR